MATYGVVRAGGEVVVGDVVVAGGVVRSTVVFGALEVFHIVEPANIQMRPAVTRAAIRPGRR